MTKRAINQNGKFTKELINTIESKFVYADKPINRLNFTEKKYDINHEDKKKFTFKIKKTIKFN